MCMVRLQSCGDQMKKGVVGRTCEKQERNMAHVFGRQILVDEDVDIKTILKRILNTWIINV
jgi:hypothetical protein